MSLITGGVMGWLTKKGELRRNWNERFTVLLPSRLMIYFSDDGCANFKSTADLRGTPTEVTIDSDPSTKVFYVETADRVWHFKALNERTVKAWCSALQYLIERDMTTMIFQIPPEIESEAKIRSSKKSKAGSSAFTGSSTSSSSKGRSAKGRSTASTAGRKTGKTKGAGKKAGGKSAKTLTVARSGDGRPQSYPPMTTVETHFLQFGTIGDVDFYESPWIAYCVTFENEDSVVKVLSEGRRHIIVSEVKKSISSSSAMKKLAAGSMTDSETVGSGAPPKRKKGKKPKKQAETIESLQDMTELIALTFSEYLGGCLDNFTDELDGLIDKTRYRSRMKSVAAVVHGDAGIKERTVPPPAASSGTRSAGTSVVSRGISGIRGSIFGMATTSTESRPVSSTAVPALAEDSVTTATASKGTLSATTSMSSLLGGGSARKKKKGHSKRTSLSFLEKYGHSSVAELKNEYERQSGLSGGDSIVPVGEARGMPVGRAGVKRKAPSMMQSGIAQGSTSAPAALFSSSSAAVMSPGLVALPDASAREHIDMFSPSSPEPPTTMSLDSQDVGATVDFPEIDDPHTPTRGRHKSPVPPPKEAMKSPTKGLRRGAKPKVAPPPPRKVGHASSTVIEEEEEDLLSGDDSDAGSVSSTKKPRKRTVMFGAPVIHEGLDDDPFEEGYDESLSDMSSGSALPSKQKSPTLMQRASLFQELASAPVVKDAVRKHTLSKRFIDIDADSDSDKEVAFGGDNSPIGISRVATVDSTKPGHTRSKSRGPAPPPRDPKRGTSVTSVSSSTSRVSPAPPPRMKSPPPRTGSSVSRSTVSSSTAPKHGHFSSEISDADSDVRNFLVSVEEKFGDIRQFARFVALDGDVDSLVSEFVNKDRGISGASDLKKAQSAERKIVSPKTAPAAAPGSGVLNLDGLFDEDVTSETPEVGSDGSISRPARFTHKRRKTLKQAKREHKKAKINAALKSGSTVPPKKMRIGKRVGSPDPIESGSLHSRLSAIIQPAKPISTERASTVSKLKSLDTPPGGSGRKESESLHSRASSQPLVFTPSFASIAPDVGPDLMPSLTIDSVIIDPEQGTDQIRRKSLVDEFKQLDILSEDPLELAAKAAKAEAERIKAEDQRRRAESDAARIAAAMRGGSSRVLSQAALFDRGSEGTLSTFDSFDFSDDDSYAFDLRPPVIIDSGSGMSKVGFSNVTVEDPLMIPTVVARRSKHAAHASGGYFRSDSTGSGGSSGLSQKYSEFTHFGDEPMSTYGASMYGELIFPMERGSVTNWKALCAFWEHILVSRMEITEIFAHPLVLTEPPSNPQSMRDQMLMHSFEDLEVPKFYLFNSALANFYYSGRTRDDFALVVDVGHGSTNISCIYMGMYLENFAVSVPFAGLDITEHLTNLLKHESMFFHLDTSYRITNQMKESLCYVSPDPRRERATNSTYKLPDGRVLKLKDEKHRAPEILFDPSFGSKSSAKKFTAAKSLHSAITLCVNQIDDDDVEKAMFNNIICCGGTTQLPGFSKRLESCLHGSVLRKYSITEPEMVKRSISVEQAKKPHLSAWLGSEMVTSLSSFEENERWITRDEYHEYGQSILHRKNTHQDL